MNKCQCGAIVPTDKCTDCATRAVAEWLRAHGKSYIADRYYGKAGR